MLKKEDLRKTQTELVERTLISLRPRLCLYFSAVSCVFGWFDVVEWCERNGAVKSPYLPSTNAILYHEGHGVNRFADHHHHPWQLTGDFRVETANTTLLLPALHDFGAHLEQAVLSFAFGEDLECLCSAVDVFLCESASLLNAVTCNDEVTGLDWKYCQHVTTQVGDVFNTTHPLYIAGL